MKAWERNLVLIGLLIAGLLFLVGAVKPAFTGLPLNVTFLVVGVACLLIGILAWRRSGRTGDE